jgi:flagellar biogenesis protein FliO
VGVLGSGGIGGYLAQMLQALFALAGVCVLAWAVLRMLARRGFGVGAPRGPSGVHVVERIPLDARRALFVVRAGERTLLLASGDAGAPRLITELSADASEDDIAQAASDAANEEAGKVANETTEPSS